MRRFFDKLFKRKPEGWDDMVSLITTAINEGEDLTVLENQLIELAESNNIPINNIKEVVSEVWEKVVNDNLENGIISEDIENNLLEIGNHFTLTQNELNINRSYTRFIQGSILREILDGKIPQSRIVTNKPIPFNLQKTEILV